MPKREENSPAERFSGKQAVECRLGVLRLKMR
jgi:hypothetical protein